MPDNANADSAYAAYPNILRPGSQADANTAAGLVAARLTDYPTNEVYGTQVETANAETVKYTIPHASN